MGTVGKHWGLFEETAIFKPNILQQEPGLLTHEAGHFEVTVSTRDALRRKQKKCISHSYWAH